MSYAEVAPFRVEVPQADLDDLQDRLRRTRWPERETVDDWSQGVPHGYLRELCRWWLDGYDWRRTEARLAAVPQVRVTVDGLGVHVLHARSPEPDALPVVLTSGWPGSVVEFVDVLAPLTDPVRHGGRAEDALHVVCPSLPGYGWSDKPTRAGWGVERIADAWARIMGALGYERFGASGSDWGTSVATALAQRVPDRVVGVHLVPPMVAPDPATAGDLTAAERTALADGERAERDGSAYAHVHRTRPQTVGYGLVDSPVALCAWVVEKLWAWTDWDTSLDEALTRDQVLDTVMGFWLPGTGASSARLYWESHQHVTDVLTQPGFDVVDVPTACTVFPRETPRPSRRWAQPRFPQIVSWREPARGGHFPALEQPVVFVDEVRRAFRAVRAARAG